MTTTANQQSRPSRSRRNTFERMLELEQRNKVNRMQASSYALHQIPLLPTNTGPRPDSRSDLERRPRALKTTDRAMTTPNLSLSIPLMQQVNGSTKYIISSQGEVIPQQEEKEEEQDSDASSICHSPGWDDISGKKRKKEKKEKEKEKKRREKEREKLESAKLHKPAARKRLSKMAVGMDRSASAPAVPVVPVVPVVQKIVETVEVVKNPGGRSRRGSLELGFRGLMHAKKAITTPWRSSHAKPVTPAEDIPPIPSSTSGFIGGLKLRQSEEANTQDVMRRLTLAMDDAGEHSLESERDAAPKLEENSPSVPVPESMVPVSIYAESVRTPSQWDSIYAQAALLASTPGDRIGNDETPIMERNVRKGRQSHPPTSRYFENEEPRSRRDMSRSSNRSSYPSDGQDSAISSPTTYDSSMLTDHPGDARHSRPSSYVQHSRQQSHDQTVTDSQGSYAVGGASHPRKSESRGRSIFNRSRSRTRNASEVRPGTAESNRIDEGVKAFMNKDDPASQLHLGQPTQSPFESTFTYPRKSSFTSSGVKGLRNAARAAFSKSGGSVHSGSDAYSSAEILTATPFRPQTGNRAATTDVASLRSSAPTKAERILGENIPSIDVDGYAPQISSRKHAPLVARRDLGPSAKSSSSSQITDKHRTHSRSSSDEYSTPEEYSNITTPTGSRPHSERGYFPRMDDSNGRSKMSMSTDAISQPKSEYFMSGAIPTDDNTESAHEEWSRSTVPMEMTDEECGKTATPGTPPVTQLLEGLNRQPSLSRSVSTPELQDLSFLPALKHQALAPRPPERSRHRKTKARTDKTPKGASGENSEPLALPLPPATKSENSSPTSPLSSQYLKNARLSLPRQTSKPFAHSPLQQAGAGGPDPIAKMFVVCCSCKYFHDMPSKIYECMAKPDNIVRDASLGVQGIVSTAVKCPWCGHGMSTSCCAGYAAVVYLRERLH